MKRTYKLGQRTRRGIAMVEFALIVTVLLGLSMAMIQYGIILNNAVNITNLGHATARYLAVQAAVGGEAHDNDDKVMEFVRANAPSNIDPNDLTVRVDPTSSSDRIQGHIIKVTITYPMSKKLFLPANFFGIPIFNTTYSTTGQMMIERGP